VLNKKVIKSLLSHSNNIFFFSFLMIQSFILREMNVRIQR